MELKLLLSFAASLLGGLFGNGSQQAPPKPPNPAPPAVEARVQANLQVPSFVTNIPSGHFAGVSVPCHTLAEARNSAIGDAVKQILGSVGVEYSHHYLGRVSGNVRNPVRQVDDRLSKIAKGIVLGVEQRIVKSSWSKDVSGRYVYFILVLYPDRNISEMRRLSRGAKVIGRVVRAGNGGIEICVTEVNGVAVTLASIDVTVRKANRYARFISYYIWKVPKSSECRFSQAIAPVRVCGSSTTVRVKLTGNEKQFSDYLLGADLYVLGIIRGTDEIGRDVTVSVDL